MKKINTEILENLVHNLLHFGTCFILFTLIVAFFGSPLKEITLTDIFQLIAMSVGWIILMIYYYANRK